MDRREALAAFGTTVVGLIAGTTVHADHDAAKSADAGPLGQMHLFLCAFHLAKKDPTLIFEAHHYCVQVADEVHQCVIFDGTGRTARLLGVEYIISDKLYRGLSDAEKKYYHPHTYEIRPGC